MSTSRRFTVKDLSLEIAVGVLFFGALAILGVFTAILGEDRLFAKPVNVEVTATSADGLGIGDAVLVRGVKVGRIEKISLLPDSVLLLTSLNADVELYEGANAEISYSSVLGGKHLAIDPGNGDGPRLPPGEPIHAQSTPDVMAEAGKLIHRIEGEIHDFKSTLEDKQLIERLARSVENIESITGEIRNGNGTLGRLVKDPALYERAEAALASVQSAGTGASETATAVSAFVAELHNSKGTFAKLLHDDSLYRNATALVERLNAGEGTIGKLLLDGTIYDNLLSFSSTLQQTGDRLAAGKSSLGRLLQDSGELYERLDTALEALAAVAAAVHSGDGTLGRLVQDPQLYEDARQALQGVNDAVDDFRQQAPISTFGSLIFGGL